MSDADDRPAADGTDDGTDGTDDGTDDGGVVAALEEHLLGETPWLTQVQVAERAGVPLEVANELWHLLGFAHVPDDEAAFTTADVRALQLTSDLIRLGILSQERQDGLVRTWGRSFARLADWQVALLASVAADVGADPTEGLLAISDEALPRVQELQSYVWRRHLLSASSRLLAEQTSGPTATLAVCFVDIVGYTSRSRTLSDRDLVTWLESFESTVLGLTVDRGGRIIKNIGDELLIVASSPEAMADIALELTRRGADPDDPFPAVRAGLAYGEVVTRLGDVFGPVVNIAARLTSVARPSSVLVDIGAYEALTGRADDDADEHTGAYRFRRLRRVSVKGYSRLKVWALQPA
ncbi:adenylate/guanylate cyclase domain-containing protein [Nocardioides daeguensis]|uniref:Adenylate/guanylate cyclase domain-containing protein n=1 Tax=Nocardioides daeguensis TaxID=908359 RepID=A0ABP6WFM1_9ACTN|nr:adenylate/guanylate cyclase domain-containing protein [Nocardioides daeguensis]MBV6727889.1 adenylate/guanylate cyclase domain-containing protein [Nocardioides daeguensis]MCR1775351.1 adenylate/guanylate cyclase domain-containing protein [Nocardioides daeguensis]